MDSGHAGVDAEDKVGDLVGDDRDSSDRDAEYGRQAQEA